MNENAFSVGRVKYKAVPAADGCDGMRVVEETSF